MRPSDVGPNVLRRASLRLAVALVFLWHTRAGWPLALLKVPSITDPTTERNEEESNNISVEINLFPPYCKKITTYGTLCI